MTLSTCPAFDHKFLGVGYCCFVLVWGAYTNVHKTRGAMNLLATQSFCSHSWFKHHWTPVQYRHAFSRAPWCGEGVVEHHFFCSYFRVRGPSRLTFCSINAFFSASMTKLTNWSFNDSLLIACGFTFSSRISLLFALLSLLLVSLKAW